MQSQTTLKQGSKSFYFAAIFMPPKDRRRLAFLYQIARQIDDLGDFSEENDWSRDEVETRIRNLIESVEVREFFDHNQIPIRLLEELGEGVLQDLDQKRYSSFDQLYRYCYLVAGTVGRMIAHLFKVTNQASLQQAEELGVAMQLTNILRDIEEDLDRDLIYLPNDDMERFGVTYDQIIERRFDDNYHKLIEFQIDRAYDYYNLGSVGLKRLPLRVRWGMRVAWYVYSGILDKVKGNGGNPYLGRVYLTTFEKILRVLRMSMQRK